MSDTEGRKQKAIRLLKEQPFEFIDHGKFQGALPKDFEPKLGTEDWGKATAVMSVIRSKPSTWQWNAARLEVAGHLPARTVKAGVKKLKQEGWVHHANVYDERHKSLTTFVVAFDSPIPEHQRIAKSRFTLIPTERGWVFGYSRDGGRYTHHTGVGKEGSYMSVQQVYGHISTVSRTQTLKRAEPDFSDPIAEEQPSIPEETAAPAKQDLEVAQNEHLITKLQKLGKKRDDSDDDALAYEEFVVQSVLPALVLPPQPEERCSRRKVWNLHWVESSLLGMLLLSMSCSSKWNVKCARRVIKRANEGYILWDDLRVLLFVFDWSRHRSERRSLEAMTFYGKQEDAMDGGKVKLHDAWAKWVKSARSDYKTETLRPVLAQRDALFPGEENAHAVNHGVLSHMHDEMRDLCTGKVKPDEKRAFCFGPLHTSAIAFMLSGARRSEKTQKMIDDSRDKILNYLATDYSGILMFGHHLGRLEEAVGITPAEVRKTHTEHVVKLLQRAGYHGIPHLTVRPLI